MDVQRECMSWEKVCVQRHATSTGLMMHALLLVQTRKWNKREGTGGRKGKKRQLCGRRGDESASTHSWSERVWEFEWNPRRILFQSNLRRFLHKWLRITELFRLALVLFYLFISLFLFPRFCSVLPRWSASGRIGAEVGSRPSSWSVWWCCSRCSATTTGACRGSTGARWMSWPRCTCRWSARTPRAAAWRSATPSSCCRSEPYGAFIQHHQPL